MRTLSTHGAALAVTVVLTAAAPTVAQTTNTVPKFTNSSGDVGNSSIVEVGGNVGIGVAVPAVKFDVNGNSRLQGALTVGANAGLITYNSSTFYVRAEGTRALSLGSNGSFDGLVLSNTGKVGVGTTTPSVAFDVNGTARLGSSSAGALLVKSTGASGAVLRPAIASGALLISDDSELAIRGLSLVSGGFVGLGTATPTARLHVVGDVVIDGFLSAKYQDVAEWVDSDAPLAAGTLVAIDPTGANRVTQTARAYDVAIAGAVSAQPGVALGVPGAGRILVAQSGRVRIKVDARFGAIRTGDLLVSSPTPGHAMRSEPLLLGDAPIHRPGTVLGKALEALGHGTGEILALLTLQ